jgi:hypothetical protein
MNLQRINPLDYPDWDALLLGSGDHSFFHTSGWARVLAESYRYKPIYFAAFENDWLSLLMPFMEISSRLTGKRGVSLPFTDHCDPFALDKRSLPEATQAALGFGKQSGWRYIEWKSTADFIDGAMPSKSYLTHDLNLEPPETELFSSLRENNRRNIRKSGKVGVTVRFDSSQGSLLDFYRLHVLTRKRHGLPPQPLSFFKNILNHVLVKGLGNIVTALHSGKVIAAAVFFHFGGTAIFKYGASDAAHLGLRPNNLVMWEAIKWYKRRGTKSLSLGRTETDNLGLLHFKRSWGARESVLKYYRYAFKKSAFCRALMRGDHPRKIFSLAPAGVLRIIGRVFYRHIG